ncbi:TcpQ domain-containing protein [Acetobacter suratthaniensis]|uniref:TcpQ domain-containing protein n=1 Tax=Acetobacter suratthaniensis TaxID=1502841 RepID=A0ABS3LNW5_9PROT|nr:TcpQ domain-containing protein [Acetobacter suratthaniensis]MBO1329043.1 TcpQ domain-containing protein [Acetobacter suratthaniensis]MCX2566936.1 TcpQ domain-containing protein [Acetobacter suratthaniensis]
MIPRTTGAALLCLTALSACATLPAEDSSHITGLNAADAQALSIQASDILTASMDPRQTTLRVLRFNPDEVGAQQALDTALRARGFALTPDGMAYPGALSVRLDLLATDQRLLMTLHAGDGEMTCSYVHDTDGQLVRKAGCTLLEGTTVTLHAPQIQTLASMSPERPPAPTHPPVARDGRVSSSTPQAAAGDDVPTAPLPDANRQWVLSRGEPIREQVIAWGAQVGWAVQWPATINWTIPATAVFTGDFADREHGPIEQIVDALAEQGHAIKVKFHTPNQTLVVTPGDVR